MKGATAGSAILAGRALRRISRQPEVLVQAVFFPVVLLLMLLAVFGDVVSATIPGDVVDRLVPLMVLEGAAFGAIAAGIAVRSDMDSGMIARVRTLPIRSGAVLYGRALADGARIAAATVVVLVVGYVVGFRFTNGPLPALGFLAAAVVVGLAFTWLSIWLGIRSRSAEAVTAVMTPLLLLCLFLCSAFVPVEGFADWLQPVVRANPFSVATNLLIGLAQGGALLVPFVQTAAWTLAIGGTSAVLALRRWHRLNAG